MEDHPLASMNASYLVTRAEHVGSAFGEEADAGALRGLVEWGEDAKEVYRVKVWAIPESTQFRAERRAQAPSAEMESAVIDGPTQSQYARLDDHGRYYVKMRFDEMASRPGRASARVRMMQPHGGNPEGFHFPRRSRARTARSSRGRATCRRA